MARSSSGHGTGRGRKSQGRCAGYGQWGMGRRARPSPIVLSRRAWLATLRHPLLPGRNPVLSGIAGLWGCPYNPAFSSRVGETRQGAVALPTLESELTSGAGRDRMRCAETERACSSMAEQWPFKPLVEGSSPSTLTQEPAGWQVFPFNPLLIDALKSGALQSCKKGELVRGGLAQASPRTNPPLNLLFVHS